MEVSNPVTTEMKPSLEQSRHKVLSFTTKNNVLVQKAKERNTT